MLVKSVLDLVKWISKAYKKKIFSVCWCGCKAFQVRLFEILEFEMAAVFKWVIFDPILTKPECV